jgi:hypothetical protein
LESEAGDRTSPARRSVVCRRVVKIPARQASKARVALETDSACEPHHADFILEADDSLVDIAAALGPIGFQRVGRSRIFIHPNSDSQSTGRVVDGRRAGCRDSAASLSRQHWGTPVHRRKLSSPVSATHFDLGYT